jgi:AP-2 complex subunit alpha
LLSTYIKWVNVFPEIKPQLLNIFERYRHVLDAELQQRACEFYALASRPEDDELLQNVCEEMPPFPARESALLGRLNRKHGDTEDKRTWIHGGKEANLERQATKRKTTLGIQPNGNGFTSASQADAQDIMTSLAGLNISESIGQIDAQNPPSDSIPIGLSPSVSDNAPRFTVGPSVDRWYEKLTYNAEGVLYEDVQIQIGIKSKYQGHLGQLAIYMGNKVSAPLTSFTTTVDVNDTEVLSASFAKISPSTIAPRTQTQQLLHVECKKMFTTPPILTVSFLAGSHQTIKLRLPIVVTKFFEHVKLGQADFFERWKLIGGPPREAQSIFPVELNAAGQLDLVKNRQIVSGHNLNVLDDIDPNLNNLVAAGVLHMSVDGKVGCLLRVEPNKDAKVRISRMYSLQRYSVLKLQLCRLTVRSTSEDVAREVQNLLQAPLKAAS